MTTPFRPTLLAAALGLSAGAAAGQQPAAPPGPPPPPAVAQPTLRTQAAAAPTIPPVISAGPSVNPYTGGGFSPYGWPGYAQIKTPVEGYLSGAADVTNANGVYMQQTQQARIMQAQADSSRLDLRRKIIDQRQYEAALQPTTEQIRRREQMDAIERARHNPPLTEIWSGGALNALLVSIQDAHRAGNFGPSVPLDPSVLAHINLTAGTTNGGSGVLRTLSNPRWPSAMLDSQFDAQRARVEQATKSALEQAPKGPIDDATARELTGAINALQDGLRAAAPDLTPTDFIHGSRFLRELRDATGLLQDANVANFFNSQWKPQGQNVAELVVFLTSKGLRFAAAVAGDEPYYTSLNASMATYDYGLRAVAGR